MYSWRMHARNTYHPRSATVLEESLIFAPGLDTAYMGLSLDSWPVLVPMIASSLRLMLSSMPDRPDESYGTVLLYKVGTTWNERACGILY